MDRVYSVQIRTKIINENNLCIIYMIVYKGTFMYEYILPYNKEMTKAVESRKQQ